MMNPKERELALQRMDETINRFYSAAVQIGNHPFQEFAGVMRAYQKSCQRAHKAGVDFTECSQHAERHLPMEGYEVEYLEEKLNCIFTGRIVAVQQP